MKLYRKVHCDILKRRAQTGNAHPSVIVRGGYTRGTVRWAGVIVSDRTSALRRALFLTYVWVDFIKRSTPYSQSFRIRVKAFKESARSSTGQSGGLRIQR